MIYFSGFLNKKKAVKMVKQTIRIFARIKPTKSKTALFEIDNEEGSSSILQFTIPKDLAGGFVNNKKESYKFKFQNVFDQSTKQDTVFNEVAQPVIDNVLTGYNGTIFAYGQTGSGKTFTITGGAERYADRGIVPRALSYIFQQIEKDRENTYTVKISYLEIYNEDGYDLLDPRHDAAKLEDLPKVHLMEDPDGNIHLKNLCLMAAVNEEEALNLLFVGDTNRMIAETPMNQASTRSHCIFTIHLICKQVGSATLRRSKLHLVDLAGSERVAKSGVNGLLLTEAKYINLSLHYLEQVIVALSEKHRSHIPYRNSMMTSVLRDSLGGNCMTSMIATCSVEKKNADESISTCRFAQRVALIKNDALLNEELDPSLVIQQLKMENAQLKKELLLKTGEERTDKLTEEEIEACSKAVDAFLDDEDAEAVLCVGADMRKIQTCFNIFKQSQKALKEKISQLSAQSSEFQNHYQAASNPQDQDVTPYFSADQEKLKNLLLQRDTEINILVNMLKKEKSKNSTIFSGQGHRSEQQQQQQRIWSQENSLDSSNRGSSGKTSNTGSSEEQRRNAHEVDAWVHQNNINHQLAEKKAQKLILGPMSMGRQEAFELFCQDYWNNPSIENKKQTLKKSYADAKHLGGQVNEARAKIKQIKSKIEQHRTQLEDSNNFQPDLEEQNLREKLEIEKKRYKDNFTYLRNLKTTIEHWQHLLEKDKAQLMKDFELWWLEQTNLAQQEKHAGNAESVVAASNQMHSPSNVSPSHPQSLPKQFALESPANSEHSKNNLPHRKTSIAQSQTPSHYGGLPLTGDAEVDADIVAFAKARQNFLRKQSGIR